MADEAIEQARRLGTPTEGEVVSLPSGLRYLDVEPGAGEPVAAGQVAVVHYTGWLTSGRKFDSSLDRNRPFRFPVGGRRVIAGWDEGVAGMRPAGVRKLIIPPELGYGDRGVGPIPGGATLIFEVKLVEVE